MSDRSQRNPQGGSRINDNLRLPVHDSGLQHFGLVTGTRSPGLAALRAQRDALAADKARLEDSLRLQDALLTAAAHDLKNSLAAITMRADLLQDRLRDDVRAPSMETPIAVSTGLTRIQATASNMAQLLDELLGLARGRAGHRLDLVLEPMDLVALTRRVVGEYLAQSAHEQIEMATTETELIGTWDPWRLEGVLRNLLSNAVKYSPQGGAIKLRVSKEQDAAGDWAVLAISDHGLGIPNSDLDAVFERFHRGANVRGHIAGSGIGLAGAQQVVQEHGGSLTVESQEGVGSTFTVRAANRAGSGPLRRCWYCSCASGGSRYVGRAQRAVQCAPVGVYSCCRARASRRAECIAYVRQGCCPGAAG